MKTEGYLCVAERHSNTATSSLRNKKTKKDAVEDADEVEDEDEESIGLKMTMMMVMKMKIFVWNWVAFEDEVIAAKNQKNTKFVGQNLVFVRQPGLWARQ